MSSTAAAPRHGRLARALRAALAHPLARDLELDSREATEVHARLIRAKPFLRRLYRHYYSHYERTVARAAPGGIVLEIGAGAGFYREIRPGVVTLDLRAGSDVTVSGNALAMPFRDGSVSAVVCMNVLHHLPDPRLFFRECTRVLRSGGRACLVEPYVSSLSRRVVRPLHHEPWDESAPWELPGSRSMSDANMAMPWAIFFRDRAHYDAEFPELRVAGIDLHTVLLYVLSGGVSMRAFLPGALFAPALFAEKLLGPARRSLASMMTVELVRC